MTDPTPDQTVSNSPSPQATSTPDTSQAPPLNPTAQNQPAAQGTLPGGNPTSPIAPNAPTPVNAQPIAPATTTGNVVSNTQPYANHPLVKEAGVKNAVLRALVGNPQQTNIDQDGNITRTPAPLSKWQLGMGLALSAISGALTGLAQSGPNANTRGAALAFQQGQAQVQQQRQAQEQQAQTSEWFS